MEEVTSYIDLAFLLMLMLFT